MTIFLVSLFFIMLLRLVVLCQLAPCVAVDDLFASIIGALRLQPFDGAVGCCFVKIVVGTSLAT